MTNAVTPRIVPMSLTRAYFPLGQTGSISEEFGQLPHEIPGVVIAQDSIKKVTRVAAGGRELVVKYWEGLNPENRQAAINELVGRRFAQEILKIIGRIKELTEATGKIIIPPAFAYETDSGNVVLATNFVQGVSHLDTAFAIGLPTEVKVAVVMPSTVGGARVFPTSSVLCRSTEGDIDVALVDWESINNPELKPDFSTQVLFCLLMVACEQEGKDTVETFKRLLAESGDAWCSVIRSEENRDSLAQMVEELIGTLPPGHALSTPKEMAEHLLDVANYHQERRFILGEEIQETVVRTSEFPPSVFNEEMALQGCGGDASLLRELIPLFLHHTYGVEMGKLKEAIRLKNPASIKGFAHSIKGSLACFYDKNQPVFTTLLVLEEMGRTGRIGQAEETYLTLESQMNSVAKFLEAFAKR